MSRRVRLLIDECLHTSLAKVATDRLYEPYHMAHLGLSGLKDHELMSRVRAEDFTLVTNNAIDFRKIFGKEPIHCGLVIIVPNLVRESSVSCLPVCWIISAIVCSKLPGSAHELSVKRKRADWEAGASTDLI